MADHEILDGASDLSPAQEAWLDAQVDKSVGSYADLRKQLEPSEAPTASAVSERVTSVAASTPETDTAAPLEPMEEDKIAKLRVFILANVSREDVSADELEELLLGEPGSGKRLAQVIGMAATADSIQKGNGAPIHRHRTAVLKGKESRAERGFNAFHPRG